jgi:hypothetical protein
MLLQELLIPFAEFLLERRLKPSLWRWDRLLASHSRPVGVLRDFVGTISSKLFLGLAQSGTARAVPVESPDGSVTGNAIDCSVNVSEPTFFWTATSAQERPAPPEHKNRD